MLHGCRKHKSTRFLIYGKTKQTNTNREKTKIKTLKLNKRDKCPFENKQKKRGKKEKKNKREQTYFVFWK